MDAETARKTDGACRAGRAHRRDRREHQRVHPGHRRVRRRGCGPTRRSRGATARQIQGLEAAIEELRVELRAITEDIVTQLDARLKEMGYSSAERRSVEQSIAEALQSLRIQLGGKVTILEDAAQVRDAAARRSGTSSSQNTLARAEGVPGEALRPGAALRALPRIRPVLPRRVPRPRRHHHAEARHRRAHQRERRAASPGCASSSDELARENDGLREKIEEYRKTLEDLRVNLARLQTQRTGHGGGDRAPGPRDAPSRRRSCTEVGVQIAETRRRVEETHASGSPRRKSERQEIEEQEKAARVRALRARRGDLQQEQGARARRRRS